MPNEPQADPFIESPDEVEVGDELYCWMPGNSDRMCCGECVAYDGTYMRDQLRDPCKLLNAVRSMAKSLAVGVKQQSQEALKTHIDSLPKPPEVR